MSNYFISIDLFFIIIGAHDQAINLLLSFIPYPKIAERNPKYQYLGAAKLQLIRDG